MGNKLVRRRHAVDEKYTRPQGLYQLGRDIDHKKLKKLILDSKLAPCYPGREECSSDLEECPICFLYYPSLNRSRCCLKGICTECFLQMKPPHTTRPTQCPFCKTPNYAVEYRGVKTKEERGKEQIEEQKVIEAQIRVQQQELHEEEEKMLQRNARSSSMTLAAMEVEDRSMTSQSVSAPSHTPLQIEDITPCDDSLITPADRQSLHTRPNREEEFDLDLEDIMVMEAIWLSIQEQDSQRLMSGGGVSTSHPSSLEDQLAASSYQMMDASPSAGFACAIASMAERQHMDSDCSRSGGQVECRSSTYSESDGRPAAANHVQESWIEVSPGTGRALPRDEVPWGREQGSEGAESRPSYTSSSVHSASDALGSSSPPMRDMEGVVDHSQNAEHGVTPEAFEDQMMLAMAMSLAEARARPYTLGPWH